MPTLAVKRASIALVLIFLSCGSGCGETDTASVAPTDHPVPALGGAVVDAETRQPVSGAVVEIVGVVSATGDGEKRRRLMVLQVYTGRDGRFRLPAREVFGRLPGWTPVPGQDPVVRIYAKGYRRLVIENSIRAQDGGVLTVNPPHATKRIWVGQGVTQALHPVPETEDGLVQELTAWKRDIETTIAQSPMPDRQAALRTQQKLLFLFDEQCVALSSAVRAQVCYGADSELGRHLAQAKAGRPGSLHRADRGGRIDERKIIITQGQIVQVPGYPSPPPGGKMGYGLLRPAPSKQEGTPSALAPVSPVSPHKAP